MEENGLNTFRAPARDGDAEFTVKRSRFIGSARICLSADEAAEMIKKFPLLYPKSHQHCWAYRIGTSAPLEHSSDAGEPAGSAGRPILGAIKRHELTNTLIVVTRYFGGIKLGVRGLIDAYKKAAELAIETAGAAEKEFNNTLLLRCGYDYSKTLTTALHKWGFTESRVNVEYGADVTARLEVPLSKRAEIEAPLSEMAGRGFLTEVACGDAPLVRDKW